MKNLKNNILNDQNEKKRFVGPLVRINRWGNLDRRHRPVCQVVSPALTSSQYLKGTRKVWSGQKPYN